MTTPVPDIAYDYEHFTHARLERILPIAQTCRVAEMDFTLLALECYTEGFAATVLMEQDWRMPSPPPPANEVELPQLLKGLPLVTEIVDDRGNRYTGHMRSGAGGGGGDSGLLNHMVYCFAPALDPAARALSFNLTQVERPNYDDGRPTWTGDDVVGGPWMLDFSLDGAGSNGLAPATVMPVARQIATDDVCVTVTTIERHTWGFVINSQIDWASASGPFPRPIWRATDDRGGEYGTGDCGGGGNLVEDGNNSWRMFCTFKPPLDPEATELRLELVAFRASQDPRNGTQDRGGRRVTRRAINNLGSIVVPLSPPARRPA